jgi:thioredoxin-like negative regulator of GroEL
MKRRALTMFILSTAAISGCGGGTGKMPTEISFMRDFDAAKVEAAKRNEPMIIDFYTDWCKWCHVLDTVTYKDSLVIAMSKDKIFVKINAEVDTSLARQFAISGYPTIVLTKPDGTEIDRIWGYLGPTDFYNQVQLYLQGKETLDDYLTRLEDEPENPEYLMTIAEKYASRSLWPKAVEFYNRVVALDMDNKRGLASKATSAIADVHGRAQDYDAAIDDCQEIIKRYTTSPEAENALAMLGYYTAENGDDAGALVIFREYLQKYPEGKESTWVKSRVADLEDKL